MPTFVNESEIAAINIVCNKILSEKIDYKTISREKLYFPQILLIFFPLPMVIYEFKLHISHMEITLKKVLFLFIFLWVSAILAYTGFFLKNLRSRLDKAKDRVSPDSLSEAVSYMSADICHIKELRKNSLQSLKFFRESCLYVTEKDTLMNSLFSGDISKVGLAPLIVSAASITIAIRSNIHTFSPTAIAIVALPLVTFGILSWHTAIGNQNMRRVIFILSNAIDSLNVDKKDK